MGGGGEEKKKIVASFRMNEYIAERRDNNERQT